jgi:hypothetical protein
MGEHLLGGRDDAIEGKGGREWTDEQSRRRNKIRMNKSLEKEEREGAECERPTNNEGTDK